MNPPVPKNGGMPVLPEMFMNAMPAPVPVRTYDMGFIEGFIHNLKLGSMAKSVQLEANIAAEKNRMVNEQLTTISSLMTFGERMKNEFIRLETERKSFEISIKKQEAELKHLELKNNLLMYEVANSEMEYKLKLKEFEEIYGSSEDQDRDQG